MTKEEAIKYLNEFILFKKISNTTEEEAIECFKLAIKALQQQPSEDEKVIRIKKGTLKARTGRYVIYDVEWLKTHFNTTEAKIYGQPNEDCISRKAVLEESNKYIEKAQSTGTKDDFISFQELIIKKLPSVTPQPKTEQEAFEDCISRAEAIKALEYELSIEADGGLDKYRTVIKDLVNAIYNTQKKAIEDLPSIQSQPKERTETHACDCISRQAVIDSLHSKFADGFNSDKWWNSTAVLNAISELPSATPQLKTEPQQKTGHWIEHKHGAIEHIECSECGIWFLKADLPRI